MVVLRCKVLVAIDGAVIMAVWEFEFDPDPGFVLFVVRADKPYHARPLQVVYQACMVPSMQVVRFRESIGPESAPTVCARESTSLCGCVVVRLSHC